MRISDWSSDVCSSDLIGIGAIDDRAHGVYQQWRHAAAVGRHRRRRRDAAQYRAGHHQRTPGFGGDWRDLQLSTRGRRRSEEHTSELQSLMRSSYYVFFLEKKNTRLYSSK